MRRLVLFGLVSLSVAAAWPAAAEAQSIVDVDVDGCGLDSETIRESISLELQVSPLPGPEALNPSLALDCEQSSATIRITIRDPVTDKHVVRSIPVPREDGEEVVSIAATQLLVASWAELLLEQATPEATVTEPRPAPPPAIERRAREVARSRVRADVGAGSSVRLEASVGGGVRWHRVADEDFVTGRATVAIGIWVIEQLRVALHAGAEAGSTARAAGDVALRRGDAGLGARVRSDVFAERLRVIGGVVGLATFENLEGQPVSPGVSGLGLSAFGFELEGNVGLRLDADPGWFALLLQGGAHVVGPSGTVPGESDVTFNGAMLGLVLEAGLTSP